MTDSESWQRMEHRIHRLEDALDAAKFSAQDLSKGIHELLDIRQAFFAKLASRPTIQEGLQKYQMLLKAADDHEGSSVWNSAIKTEHILQEMPHLRNFATVFETFNQLESVIGQISSSEFSKQTIRLEDTLQQLESLGARLTDVEESGKQYSIAETTAVDLIEDKILDIDGKLT